MNYLIVTDPQALFQFIPANDEISKVKSFITMKWKKHYQQQQAQLTIHIGKAEQYIYMISRISHIDH
jgi:predicted component of type VI protein secretion system